MNNIINIYGNVIGSQIQVGTIGSVQVNILPDEKDVLYLPKVSFGPERPTYTMSGPADHPVFNSITDNPTIGDERYFVRIGKIENKHTNLKTSVVINPECRYLVYIFFHNNASKTYNDKAHNHKGVALRTRLSCEFPKVLRKHSSVCATISTDNADPPSVWASALLTTQSDSVRLKYIPGSAKLYCDGKANGSVMPSTLFSPQGTLIGLNQLNGVVPGCEEYHGVVTFVIQAD